METKAKVNAYRNQSYRTGGGSPPTPPDLTEAEKKVIRTVGLDAVDGDPQVFEIGIVNPPGYTGLPKESIKLKEDPKHAIKSNENRKRPHPTAMSATHDSNTKKKPNASQSFAQQQSMTDAVNSVLEKVEKLVALETRRVLQNTKIIDRLEKIASNRRQ